MTATLTMFYGISIIVAVIAFLFAAYLGQRSGAVDKVYSLFYYPFSFIYSFILL